MTLPESSMINPGLSYSRQLNGYDEAYQQDAEMSAQWQKVVSLIGEHSPSHLQQRLTKLERILRDDGALVRNKEDSTWPLDAVPWLIEKPSWEPVEFGLRERGELLNRLLKDIYGEQTVIRQGVIPPEALFTDPGFLRPCFGIPLGEQPLTFYSADLVRNAEGELSVLMDRTQALNGVGYALENRTAMSRVFPNFFRKLPVKDLSFFFQMMRYQLHRLSMNQELPNIVLLTSNSKNDYYFEHTLLANYLGFTLVQGRDLTVRNGYVWLKSLDGLSRVDIILRHVKDVDCDPAELRGDSYWGIPGLLEVVRNQHVSVVNPLGSGALENPILMKYSQTISQFFTGRPLSLGNVNTYWAFDPLDREYMLDNIHNLVIKPIGYHEPRSILGDKLSAQKIAELRQKIIDSPLHFAAQDYTQPSYLPAWKINEGLVAKPSVLRCFTFASNSEYHVMPGGLARSAKNHGQNNSDTVLINFQRQAITKDVWVMSDSAAKDSPLTQEISQKPSFNASLPSRVVENMFWLGRYMIRSESSLRLLRTVFMQVNNSRALSPSCYKQLLNSVTKVTNTFPGFGEANPETYSNAEEELFSIVVNEKRIGSLAANVREMLNCSDEVQTLLSSDTQRVISDLRQELSGLDSQLEDFSSAPEEALDPLVTSLLALSGLIQESMIRGYGWRFIKLGRLIEGCEQTLSLLDALIVPALDEYDEYVTLESVLLTAETLNTFRRRFGANNSVSNGLEIMLADTSNPRSLVYLLNELRLSIESLPNYNTQTDAGLTNRQLLIKLNHDIELANIERLALVNPRKNQRNNLANLVNSSQGLLAKLYESISRQYFDHTDVDHHAFDMPWKNR